MQHLAAGRSIGGAMFETATSTRRRPSCRPTRSSCGHTLAELLVVLAIGGLLTGLAIPSLAGLVAQQRQTGAVQRFVGALHHARDEAIKRNGRVVLCKSANASVCSHSGRWDQGWLMFHDADNDAARDPDEPLIAQAGPLPPGWQLGGNAPVANYVSYRANGTAALVSGAFQAGSFTLCAPNKSLAASQRIILSATGRPRVGPAVAGDCTGGGPA